MNRPLLILPGIGNSGPQHWQSLWQNTDPRFRRVVQQNWDRPVCADWCAALEQAVAIAGPETVLVAHSLGCLLVAHWASRSQRRIRAALLVALPDPSGPLFPTDAASFGPVPMQSLPFASLVVASSTDPYCSLQQAARCAAAWGSRFVNVGDAGHINSSSGHGLWPEGRALLQGLLDESPA